MPRRNRPQEQRQQPKKDRRRAEMVRRRRARRTGKPLAFTLMRQPQ